MGACDEHYRIYGRTFLLAIRWDGLVDGENDGDARTSRANVMSNVFVPRTCLIEQITIFDGCGD